MNAGEEWLERACFVWEQQGRIYPALWAHGEERFCVAIPKDAEAADVSPLLQAVLLTLMAQTVQALYVGTMHEAWTRTFFDTEEVANLKPGELEKMAEIDPQIRTSILTTWGDLSTGKICQDMASLSISDFGEVQWETDHSSNPEGVLTELVRSVMSGEGFPADDPETVVAGVAESMNWQVMLWSE